MAGKFNQWRGTLAHYDPQFTARAGGLPSMGSIPTASPDTAGAKIFRYLDDFMKIAGPIIGRAYVRQQEARIDDSVIAAKEKFQTWQAQYMQANQGKLALNAAQDFVTKYGEIVNETVEQFDGRSYEVFEDKLKRKLAMAGLAFASQGMRWQARQAELYGQSIDLAMRQDFLNAAGQNYDNPLVLESAAAEYAKSVNARNPGFNNSEEIAKAEREAFQASLASAMANNNLEAAQALVNREKLRIARAGKYGASVARFESGGEGVTAVGTLNTDGTSVGRYQICANAGSLDEWLGELARTGPQGAAIAGKLKRNNASAYNNNEWRQLYKQLAKDNPDLFENSQYDYIYRRKYLPALRSLPPDLQERVSTDNGLRDALWSTAIQHGEGNAKNIWNGVYKKGMSRDELIDSVYEKRKQYLGKSDAKTRQAIINRYGEEKEVVRNVRNTATTSAHILQAQQAIDNARQHKDIEGRIEISNALEDFTAKANAGQAVEVPFNKAQIVGAYGLEKGERIWQELNDLAETSKIISAGKNATKWERAKILQEYNPNNGPIEGFAMREKKYNVIAKAFQRIQQEFDKDTTGFIVANHENTRKAAIALGKNLTPETAQNYVNSLLAEKERHAIRSRQLLTDDMKVAFSESLATSKNPVALLASLRHCFGKHFATVMNDLSEELGAEYVIVGSGMREAAGNLLMETFRDPEYKDTAAQVLAWRDPQGDINNTVASKLASENFTVYAAGSKRNRDAMENSVARLAIQYMGKQNLSMQDAVNKAYNEVIGYRYDFRPQKENPALRIPKGNGVNPNTVMRGIQLFNYNINLDDFAIAEVLPEEKERTDAAIKDKLKRQSYWLTNEDESGAILFLLGNAVLDKQGKPVQKTWAELMDLAYGKTGSE